MKTPVNRYRSIFSVLLLCTAALVHAESGTLIRQSDLKQKPFLDAATVTRVSVGSSVTVTGRQGAWMQVKTTSGQSGWVKLLNVRTSSGTASSGSTLGTLAKVITTGSSGTTVTTGVKGLTSPEVTSTHPNPQELNKLNGYAVSSSKAAQAARAANLTSKSVPYIDPTTAATTGNAPARGGN
ncbi:SH3 domain-containing protein [Silvimonas sp.]|uniref:SH3 domain-containing protein n=1 Tax=Silvimonas sp. TaxID=2650811 RepID=UPI00284FBBF9|nr:SH3 domain-containing protein [Silvimonas sp.]MDR3428263.1 SH3 domain-containing protein [Silvimonas sp.]